MRRLFVSMLCLALLVAGLSWLGVQLAGYQRQQIALELAERIQSGNEALASAAVGELPSLNEVGLPALVAAAGSSRPRVAPAARWAVDDLLLKWRDETKKNSKQYAQRLTLLAQEMATQASLCSPEGQRWLRELASRVLLASGKLAPGDSPLVVAYCDTVLRETVNSQPVATQQITPPDQPKSTHGDRLAVLPLAIQQAPSKQPVESLPVFTTPPANAPAAIAAEDNHLLNTLRQVPQEIDSPFGFSKSSPEERPAAQLPFRRPRTTKRVSKLEQPLSTGQTSQVRELASLQVTQVLRRLVQSSEVERPVIGDELSRRGLDPIPIPLARMLISREATERIRGVDALLRTPNVRPGPWLSLLAEDASAEVRLVVIGLLSTSENPELLERAWQIALHDQDPRVARLTRTIQAKRDGTSRR